MIPVSGARVSCKYGALGHHWAGGRHRGIDYAAPAGTLVVAPWAGRIIGVGLWGPAYGSHAPVIDFSRLPDGSPGLWGVLAHVTHLMVRPGQMVAAGQPIARVGSEGNATGPHLHFEIQAGRAWSSWTHHKERDPRAWLDAVKVPRDVGP